MRFMRSQKNKSLSVMVAAALICVVVIALSASLSAATKTKQETFPSPEDAVKALIEAVKTDNTDKFVAILGSGFKSLFSSGDEVEDKLAMERFVKSYEEKNRIEKKGADRAILYTG
ncbi:MAG TPA: DUF2950 family protein, partial [Thermodesulfovibrionales bacterium]|nr:DUF2950 family protein [Thermodesulfovibrionales bacterium]